MGKLKQWALGGLFGLFGFYAVGFASIALFTVPSRPLQHVPRGVAVCALRRMHPIRFRVSDTGNDAETSTIKAWLSAHPGEVNTYASKSVCHDKASMLNLQYLPAVVKDTYVVYGETDVKRALKAIARYRLDALSRKRNETLKLSNRTTTKAGL